MLQNWNIYAYVIPDYLLIHNIYKFSWYLSKPYIEDTLC